MDAVSVVMVKDQSLTEPAGVVHQMSQRQIVGDRFGKKALDESVGFFPRQTTRHFTTCQQISVRHPATGR
jgi:hypothetical protein